MVLFVCDTGTKIRALSYRPAPIQVDKCGNSTSIALLMSVFEHSVVQVNFIGYPGPSGAAFIDYIAGDRIATPPEHSSHFTEKILVLPTTYLVRDSHSVATRR